MNLLLFIGTYFFGSAAFKIVFTVILIIPIVLAVYNTARTGTILWLPDLAVYAVFFLVMLAFSFPVKPIIWIFPFLHLALAIYEVTINLVVEDEVYIPIQYIVFILCDIAGLILFYKF